MINETQHIAVIYMNTIHICTTVQFGNNIFLSNYSSNRVYIVSGLTGTGLERPTNNEENIPDSGGTPSSGNIVNLGGQQFYAFENNDSESQRTILVPIRSSTPPPSYNSIFGAHQIVEK